MLGLKNPMPMPAQPDPANSPTGATIADKLTGGQGIAQEVPQAKTVGAVVNGSGGIAQEGPIKGFEQKPSRSGKTI